MFVCVFTVLMIAASSLISLPSPQNPLRGLSSRSYRRRSGRMSSREEQEEAKEEDEEEHEE